MPYISVNNSSARVEHEATTSRISDDQLFYCMQRGLSAEDSISMIVNGFCKQVLQKLPMEFAVEAQKLVAISLDDWSWSSPGFVDSYGLTDSSRSRALLS